MALRARWIWLLLTGPVAMGAAGCRSGGLADACVRHCGACGAMDLATCRTTCDGVVEEATDRGCAREYLDYYECVTGATTGSCASREMACASSRPELTCEPTGDGGGPGLDVGDAPIPAVDAPGPRCGDGLCQTSAGESCSSCAPDCGPCSVDAGPTCSMTTIPNPSPACDYATYSCLSSGGGGGCYSSDSDPVGCNICIVQDTAAQCTMAGSCRTPFSNLFCCLQAACPSATASCRYAALTGSGACVDELAAVNSDSSCISCASLRPTYCFR